MIFSETALKGAFVIDLERRQDARGFFARAFCQNEFKAHGLKPVVAPLPQWRQAYAWPTPGLCVDNTARTISGGQTVCVP